MGAGRTEEGSRRRESQRKGGREGREDQEEVKDEEEAMEDEKLAADHGREKRENSGRKECNRIPPDEQPSVSTCTFLRRKMSSTSKLGDNNRLFE